MQKSQQDCAMNSNAGGLNWIDTVERSKMQEALRLRRAVQTWTTAT